jgi:hypothetical protein
VSGSEALFGIFPGLAPAGTCRIVPVPTRERQPGIGAPGTRLGGRRTHAPLKVGDQFPTGTVIALVERDGTCNERVEIRCPRCGRESVVYAFNLRKAQRCLGCTR